MDGPALLHRLGVALAIGLLIGAERHWRDRADEAGQRTAGVRTFTITGLTGGIIGALTLALPAGRGWRRRCWSGSACSGRAGR